MQKFADMRPSLDALMQTQQTATSAPAAAPPSHPILRATPDANVISAPPSANYRSKLADIASLLPQSARSKFVEMRDVASERRMISIELAGKKNELIGERIAAQEMLNKVERDMRAGKVAGARTEAEIDSHPRVVELRATVERITTECDRISDRSERAKAHHHAVGGAVSRCSDYLKSLPASVELTAIKPKAGKASDLAKLRAAITAKAEEIALIRCAPLPASLLKKQAAEYVEALAARGRPQIFNTCQAGFADEPPRFREIRAAPVGVNNWARWYSNTVKAAGVSSHSSAARPFKE